MAELDRIRETWVYHPKNHTLQFYDENAKKLYEVPIDDLTTGTKILDWIMQIYEKSWVTPERFHALVEGLDYLTGGIQAKYCSGGKRGKTTRKPLESKRLGWRIFPRPKSNLHGRSKVIDFVKLGAEIDKKHSAWTKECERVCKAIFETS